MEAFNLESLARHHEALNQRWAEFLRVDSLSAGIYRLPAGETDLQRPHAEDEIYFVIRGKAILRVGDEERPVAPGDLLYVPRNADHRFFNISEDLVLLVVFAPAEGTAERHEEHEREAGV
ncbi:MAG: cupin domain-containing protein [Oscillochloris sp.]|nr:cupin domain-containing protein [Oscillochloris sp.]